MQEILLPWTKIFAIQITDGMESQISYRRYFFKRGFEDILDLRHLQISSPQRSVECVMIENFHSPSRRSDETVGVPSYVIVMS